MKNLLKIQFFMLLLTSILAVGCGGGGEVGQAAPGASASAGDVLEGIDGGISNQELLAMRNLRLQSIQTYKETGRRSLDQRFIKPDGNSDNKGVGDIDFVVANLERVIRARVNQALINANYSNLKADQNNCNIYAVPHFLSANGGKITQESTEGGVFSGTTYEKRLVSVSDAILNARLHKYFYAKNEMPLANSDIIADLGEFYKNYTIGVYNEGGKQAVKYVSENKGTDDSIDADIFYTFTLDCKIKTVETLDEYEKTDQGHSFTFSEKNSNITDFVNITGAEVVGSSEITKDLQEALDMREQNVVYYVYTHDYVQAGLVKKGTKQQIEANLQVIRSAGFLSDSITIDYATIDARDSNRNLPDVNIDPIDTSKAIMVNKIIATYNLKDMK